jgi:cyclic pyranopterin monophosphate synthase
MAHTYGGGRSIGRNGYDRHQAGRSSRLSAAHPRIQEDCASSARLLSRIGADVKENGKMDAKLTHLDDGAAVMVDVSDKPPTLREATAIGRIRIATEAIDAIRHGSIQKGDVLAVARVAGIMAAKKTSALIPLCHPLPISGVALSLIIEREHIQAECTVRSTHNTGVEMEALTAVSVALLTIYDMAKALDRGMVICDVRLEAKSGGRSGDWLRANAA